MGPHHMMFEVHHGGTFDRQHRVHYVGGLVSNYPDTYDPSQLKFSDIEDICKSYGYRSGDLVYYNVPGCPLDEGLRLMSSDHNVAEMVAAHVGHDLVVLYMVMHGVVDVDVAVEDGEEDSEYEKAVVYRKDAFWDSVLSDDTDCVDSDEDGYIGARVRNGEGVDTDGNGNGNGDGDGDVNGGGNDDGSDGGDGDDAVNAGEYGGDGNDGQHRGVEQIGESDGSEYNDDSEGLRSPSESGEDSARLPRRDITRKVPFDLSDMKNPTLVIGNTFRNASDFRKAVRQYNILRGKDLRFKKNELKRIVVVCKDSNCKYRVYGRQLKNEQTFLLVSIRPKHTCTRRYQNHMVTSTWIAEWCMDSFMEQPNMPIDVLRKKVKNKWNVDVHVSSLYRARKKARESIYGKLDEQYHRLWDYCSVVRSTNVGSCLILMVERPMPEVPCRFQRLYVSLAAMKNGFREGCRPVVGVDACFLKGHYKGQLMAAVGRDANNNMYPIAMAVVEAETKDSWTWFLEALVADLGPTPHGWTFISDRQKVN
jgi:hypothetical protein